VHDEEEVVRPPDITLTAGRTVVIVVLVIRHVERQRNISIWEKYIMFI
jgi:hypothetical protein